tara:strand:- start:818 stop:2308 length:1491 start_codon:yes stop_codon:yes gene_type:complete
MSRYRKTMKETLREVRGFIKEDTTTSYPPKEINKKKHASYKDPKKGEREILTKETSDPSVDDIAKGLKLDKKLVKKIMGEVFDYDEKVLDENVSQQIRTLKTIMAPMRGAKISIDGAQKLMNIMNKFDKKEDLIDLFKADIPFVSQSAAARLISKFRMSGAEVNKLREKVEEEEIPANVKKIAKELDKAVDMHKSQAKRLRKAGIKETPDIYEGTMRGGLITDRVDEILKVGPKFVNLVSKRPSVKALSRMCVDNLFDDSLLDDFFYIDPSSEGIVKGGNPDAKKAYGKHASALNRVDPRSVLLFNLVGRKFQGRNDGLMNHSLGAAMLALHIAQLRVPAVEVNPDLELLDNPNYKGTKKINPNPILQNYQVSISQIMQVIKAHMRNMRVDEVNKLKTLMPKNLQISMENVIYEGAKDLVEKIKGLQNKAEKSGMPYGILKKVYDRGMAAWKGGHRPGASQQQWAFARVNSFITKSSGTWGGADKDLAKQVRSAKK